ncbi:MAG: 2Fe-2S iron-sulfur cluster binding domain-containing protein [Phaeodactylibacter sp.]|nr:2Fe-2S iron-sulfur cluster binding domain-containing protein [Phaeodactylibacter sp.]
MPTPHYRITVIEKNQALKSWEVPAGSNLRMALLNHGISPYTPLTKNINCGGRGICATCGVWITGTPPAPAHWHDKAAQRFGYPRLSCQVTVDQDLQIELVDKWIWGGRRGAK